MNAPAQVTLANGIVVTRTRIIGTDTVVYAAWEQMAGHSTMRFFEDVSAYMGRIGTRQLPVELYTLPAYSDERYERVTEWQTNEYARAYAAIEEAYPHTTGSRRSMGECTI